MEYYRRNKEKLLALHYKWRKLHPEKVREESKRHREKVKRDPELLARYKEWYRKNKEKISLRSKLREQTPKGRFSKYRSSAKTRNVPFQLNLRDFENLWKQPCYYCGKEISTIGLDRIDPLKGYLPNNIRPCCIICNRMKNKSSESKFLQYCKAITQHLKL